MGRQSWLWLVGLLLVSVACTIGLGGPTPPAPPITPPPDAAESLKQTWAQAVASAGPDGRITVVLTEAQLTGLLAKKMASNPDAAFQEPQVFLRDGALYIYGKVRQGNFTANVMVVLTAEIDEQGTLQLRLTRADFGPWPVPDDLLSGLSAMLDEAFTGKIGPAFTGLRLESVTIADGTLTLVGRIR